MWKLSVKCVTAKMSAAFSKYQTCAATRQARSSLVFELVKHWRVNFKLTNNGKKNKMISAKQCYWLPSLALVRWDLRINVIMMVLKQCIAVSFVCSTQTLFKTNGVLCHIREVKSFILSVLIITSVASSRYFPTLLWSLLYFTYSYSIFFIINVA